ncbi:agamous-like MADS-box protein AGL65 isoform X2 [Gastrolobium bilobum]|uniref:agamous-like MADS-box protein AGL65 isoform X2 n=1 Tax=Gastrolobium bilobum TaxID=150636 RepID=UPI002AB2199D|nr:agamous-like MADS-box protein AGL65 isoform X2 [Gastrolobium bilobum]
MGRVKLRIKKLESTSTRHVTYSKRKSGILKKAKELSILCDIHIALLMFSPTGKPTLLQGQRRGANGLVCGSQIKKIKTNHHSLFGSVPYQSTFEEVIAKFAQLNPQERAKRKLENLEALKKTFKKLDHDVKVQDFLGSSQIVEELTHKVRILQAQLSEVHERLSYWINVEKINNLEHIRQIEDSLRESINRVHLQKENIRKHQMISLECASQLQEGMSLPLMMSDVQESQHLPWLLTNDNHQLMFPSEPNFLPFRYNPNRDAECSPDVSLPGYSGYIGSNKLEVSRSPQVSTLCQGGGALDELNGAACLDVQHCEQFAYPPPPDNEQVKHHPEMNSKPNPEIYQVHNGFDTPRPLFETGYQFWSSASGPCGIAMYNENGYHRVRCPLLYSI